jgi:FkbM family methyltransferase
MRSLAKLRRSINQFLIPTGFQIERSRDYLPFTFPVKKKFLRTGFQQRQTNDFLIRFGTDCDLLIDVGANRGTFADHFTWLNPATRILLIEPIPSLFNALVSKYKSFNHYSFSQKAVSDRNSQANFHVTANDGQSSSLLNLGARHIEAAPHAAEVERIVVEVSTIDEITKDLRFRNAFLKIDVQGNEMAALAGAINTLDRVNAIHIEVSIQSLYQGDSLGFQVWEFLEKHNFVLYGIDPWFRDPRSNGELLQADFFFVSKKLLN